MQRDTENLLFTIEQQIEGMKKEYVNEYPEYMKKALIESNQGMTKVELQYLEQKLTEKTKGEIGFIDKKIEAEKLGHSFWDRIFGNKPEGQSIIEIEHEVDKTTADELFEKVKTQFSEAVSNANGILNENSKECWKNNAKDMRTRLVRIILEDDSIQEAKKNELFEVIESYQDIPLEDATEALFLREHYGKYLFSIGTIKIGESYKLNLSKLGATFNRKLNEYVENTYTRISESHREAFVNWSGDLYANICAHIQEMNPTLKDLVERIKIDTNRIADLESRQNRLAEYIGQIENLMTWRTK